MALSPKGRSKNMANCSGVFALAFIFLRRFKITILEDDWRKLLRERIRAERETRLYK